MRDQLYPVRVDNANRTAVLDAEGNILPGAIDALSAENRVTIGKIFWLSKRESGKAYGSMVVYATKRSDAERLLDGYYFDLAGESATTHVFEPRTGPIQCFNCQEIGHKAYSCKKQRTCGKCADVGHHHRECTAIEPKCRDVVQQSLMNDAGLADFAALAISGDVRSSPKLGKSQNGVMSMEPMLSAALTQACVPRKDRALCRRWYYLHWAPSTDVMPSELLEKLRERLENQNFRHCGIRTQSGVYEALVKIGPGSRPVSASHLIPDAQVTLFDGKKSQAWHLKCCWDAFGDDVVVWIKALRETQDRTIFGDKRMPYELLRVVRAAGLAKRAIWKGGKSHKERISQINRIGLLRMYGGDNATQAA
ncbi:hypothetical protein HIM_10960 [Hirsutella minnesotensis 3608]|uniref:CCHC-type domain-containing protein n=1 Tax=Hirsutella minnesotensis 3608 TaxID=1043627 RepID=A0A0F8A1R7_9HYPO|nr:hypothetical protein HIM_10960 [Hirsutella minnesotensis 3608]